MAQDARKRPVVTAWERFTGNESTGEPRDKHRDLVVPHHWALIGPGAGDEWGASVIDATTGETVAGWAVASEDAAEQAVAAWETAHVQSPA